MTNQLTATDLHTITARPPTGATTITATTPPGRPGKGRRWMVVAGGAAIAVVAAVAFSSLGGDSTDVDTSVSDQRSAYQIVQHEIDAALVERNGAAELVVQRPAYLTVQNEIDAALAEHNGVTAEERPTAQLVQTEIDAALAEHNGVTAEERPTAQLVQDEIDAALAERNEVSVATGR